METTTAKHGPALAATASDYLDRLVADEKREEVWEDLDYTRFCLVDVIHTYRMDGISDEEIRAMLGTTGIPSHIIRELLGDE
jgi:DNA-directed RNA polymerase subunit N (RpoN/RPB10)